MTGLGEDEDYEDEDEVRFAYLVLVLAGKEQVAERRGARREHAADRAEARVLGAAVVGADLEEDVAELLALELCAECERKFEHRARKNEQRASKWRAKLSKERAKK